MKLHLPPLLYSASLALLGFAGWAAIEALPLWKEEVRLKAHTKGHDDATSLRTRGREQGPRSSNWAYSPKQWWDGLKTANLTGALPPEPTPPPGGGQQAQETVVAVPLAQLIELVSLVHDGETDGKGGSSHVVVRFKPDVIVRAPAWWVKENTAPPPSRVAAAMATRDGAASKGAQGRANQGNAGKLTAPATPPSGQVVVQKLWVQDDGDPRRSATLWAIDAKDSAVDSQEKSVIGTIRLVRVSDDAQRAFFERQLPPPRPGEPAPAPTEEVLIKTEFDLSQDLLSELLALRHSTPVAAPAPKAIAPARSWIETKATARIDGAYQVGTDDEARFRDDSDRLLETLDVDVYTGRNGTVGLIVRGIDAKLGASFGIERGDVLVEINGRKVESKAQAHSLVVGDYERGVRTFQTRWLSNGVRVERIYVAR